MDKLKMHSVDFTGSNVEAIARLFPNCLTECIGADGKARAAIDFDLLKQELSDDVVEGNQERYQFTWPDKKKAIRLANAPTNMTLRPCREKSVDFDETENLYIEGDNLEVLKLLREDYLGRIKMIYIDPPYNTGNDFVYEDDFSQAAAGYLGNSGQMDELGNRLVQNTESNGRFHTDWLNMIYPRLKVCKDLLSSDGVIFISMDDNEIDNLKKVCSEVFGERNFVGQWNWYKSATPPNLSKKIKKNVEYILCYQKGGNNDVFTGIQKFSSSDDPITKPQNTIKELRFSPGVLHAKCADGVYPAGTYGTSKFPNVLKNDLIIKDGVNQNEVVFENRFIWLQSKLEEEVANGTRINLSKALVISYKKADYGAEVPPNMIDTSVNVDTTENAGNMVTQMFDGHKVFDYPKPVSLIAYLTNFLIKKDESATILDFFSGSATTAHAIMKLNSKDGGNRKYIMVQLPEETDPKSEAHKCGYKTICEIGEERIRRAGKMVLEEMNTSSVEGGLFSDIEEKNSKVDVGFRVLKLDSSNMEDVFYRPEDSSESTLFEDNVKPDRTGEDLLFQVMLECNLPLSAKIQTEKISGKEVFSVNNGYLIACFDEDVNEAVITAVAKRKPYYFIMRDKSLSSDNVADNFEQIFQAYSKETIRRIL